MRHKDDPRAVAFQIAVERTIEPLLRRHTALICWNGGDVSPVNEIADNGTCCLVEAESARLVVTCSHVWKGFEQYGKKQQAELSISLVANDEPLARSFAFPVKNLRLVSEDARLDLATFSFDGIDLLESWRFYRLRPGNHSKVCEGDCVFFLGFTGDGVRKASMDRRLRYTVVANQVTDVGHNRFLLHNKPGTGHLVGRQGDELPPERWPGISGSPVFRVKTLIQPDPVLVGFVSQLSSCGLSNSSLDPVGRNSEGGHEMSNGDIYVTHSDFIGSDGIIQA